MVTSRPLRVPEYVPDTEPRSAAATYPSRPRSSRKLMSRSPDGEVPSVIARAYLQIRTVSQSQVKLHLCSALRSKETRAVRLRLLVARIHVEVKFLLSRPLIIDIYTPKSDRFPGTNGKTSAPRKKGPPDELSYPTPGMIVYAPTPSPVTPWT